jgi:hypothetical protein
LKRKFTGNGGKNGEKVVKFAEGHYRDISYANAR